MMRLLVGRYCLCQCDVTVLLGFMSPFCCRCSAKLVGIGVAVAFNIDLTRVYMADLAVIATALIVPAVGDVEVQLVASYTSSWCLRIVISGF